MDYLKKINKRRYNKTYYQLHKPILKFKLKQNYIKNRAITNFKKQIKNPILKFLVSEVLKWQIQKNLITI